MEQHFELKEYNTKKKKGTYLVIKTEGQKTNYYKYDYDTPIDAYLQYDKEKKENKKTKYSLEKYKQEYKNFLETKSKTPLLRQKIKRHIQKITNRPNITDIFKKGISATVIRNTENITTKDIQEALKKVLRPLVIDNRFLEILAQNNNVEQYKSRLEHNIRILNNKGEELSTGNTTNKNTYTVVQELQKNLRKGEEITDGSKTQFQNKMNMLKYNMNNKKSGNLHTIELTIILRKG